MPVPLWRLCCLDSAAYGLWSPLHSGLSLHAALPAKGDTLADSYAAFVAGPICCHIFCTGHASACPIQLGACQCAGNIITAWSLTSSSTFWFDSYCAIAILFYFLGAYLLLDVVWQPLAFLCYLWSGGWTVFILPCSKGAQCFLLIFFFSFFSFGGRVTCKYCYFWMLPAVFELR